MSVDSKTLASTVEEISSMDDSALAQAVRRVHRESAEASDPIAAFGVQSAQLISLVDAAPRGRAEAPFPHVASGRKAWYVNLLCPNAATACTARMARRSPELGRLGTTGMDPSADSSVPL